MGLNWQIMTIHSYPESNHRQTCCSWHAEGLCSPGCWTNCLSLSVQILRMQVRHWFLQLMPRIPATLRSGSDDFP